MCRLLLFIICSFSFLCHAAPVPDEQQILHELEQAKAAKNQPAQGQIQDALQSALSSLDERKGSISRAREYQQVINHFPKQSQQLHQQISTLSATPLPVIAENISPEVLNQRILQVSSQLLEKNRQLQQQQERIRDITESLVLLPRQQTEVLRQLDDIEQRAQSQPDVISALTQAQHSALMAESAHLKALAEELELAQLSSSNRLTLARLEVQFTQKQNQKLDLQLQNLRAQQNVLRQKTAERALETAQQLAASTENLPESIVQQFTLDQQLSQTLNQQAQQLKTVTEQQRLVGSQITQARQVLATLREQAQWPNLSSTLSEALRAQVARLPALSKSHSVDTEIAQLRVQRIRYENLLGKQAQLRQRELADSQLTHEQQNILSSQLDSQRDLLSSLLQSSDTLVLEFTRLKAASNQLEDVLQQVRNATHRYLFWTADLHPISTGWWLSLVRDLRQLISLDTFSQLGRATVIMFTSKHTLLPLFLALILVGISISSRRHFTDFLQRSSAKVGKVTQDYFLLTLRTLFWSILVALPLPVLWMTLGYGWQEAWSYPIAVAAGESVTATVPLLWVVMICAVFARPNGLFIAHFGWPHARVAKAMRYYLMSIGFIVPLIMALIMFDRFNEREFAGSLGRLVFILICGALVVVTLSLKRAGIPLWINKLGNNKNLINTLFWNLLLCAPLLAMLAATVGYLATAQALLARLETSVAIWFFLLVIYSVIRRWMLIQKRRLAFDRAKQRRAEMLAQRARSEEDADNTSNEVDEPEVDLDTISAQSLRLVRSILVMIALLSMIALWSEIHSAFSFLENITLWDVTSSVKGVESLEPITLGAVFIAILVIIITMQLVRNLPALLELAILQHLDLTPGTGYAITTITKYLLMLIGSLVGFSMIGIEWSKLQWLVAALGVGLGFGLQEIFANFISGLIILFEKPIRIGDTVTIRNLTGSITRINTRATTISDWDRKEIIVPNKAFITEQFINWSLSDSVTRVVLTVPAPADANSELVTQILHQAAQRCSLVLDNPAPEIFLVDLQQGIQIFEVRVYAAEMNHRMPLRHELHQLIIKGFHDHHIELPFPPFQIRTPGLEALNASKPISSGKPRKTGEI